MRVPHKRFAVLYFKMITLTGVQLLGTVCLDLSLNQSMLLCLNII